MSRKSVKKNNSKISEDILKENKYFQTVLLAYYMLTRNEDVLQSAKKIKDKTFVSNLFEEYKRYIAGYDLDIFVENDESNMTFKVPDFTTIKANSMLQILKKTPKI